MKALILAAGLGTRLLPYTKYLHKTLFPIAGRPLLDIIIHNLLQAGCKEIIINTHHLHDQIERFIAGHKYAPLMTIRHETEILGTGGAIKNVADFWDDKPFIVINSDILTNIDIGKVYDFHLSHDHPATLVLHDCDMYNNVSVTKDNFIMGFHQHIDTSSSNALTQFAFTGIQVIDSELVSLVPENTFYSSIDLYRKSISNQLGIKAFISKHHFWKDIGTPQAYREAAFEYCSRKAFRQAFHDLPEEPVSCTKLEGDGSDRQWYRLMAGTRSLVLADHNIRAPDKVTEADSFVSIGQHLLAREIPVPKIHFHDTFSGLVFLEDVGDEKFQDRILKTTCKKGVVKNYKAVIDLLIRMSLRGKEGFDPSIAYQTSFYDKELIIEKECGYFVNAFLNAFLGIDVAPSDLSEDFSYLADKALQYAVTGFMHRDFQSRNIMIKKNRFYFIDFQGGRLGPIQYDLASLLIDPYVGLPFSEQALLAEYCAKKISSIRAIDPNEFLSSYRYCILTRNLQILGAFGYLSREKGKKWFEQYIPTAIRTLKHYVNKLDSKELTRLKGAIDLIPDPGAPFSDK